MKRYIAAIAGLMMGLAAFLAVIVGTTAPADATIRFCKAAPGVPCIGYANGCTLNMGDHQYVFAEDGDSVIDGSGVKYTCSKGTWNRALRGANVQIGPVLGQGQFTQGPPVDPCTLTKAFCSPPPIG